MRLENAIANDVLERILSAYGFTMQKELCDKLGIAKSNAASWLQRGQVPGNVILQCALDTGADANWLVTGELANASFEINDKPKKGKPLLDEILASGGKAVLRRILDAYGFSTQKELGDLLGISSGTISTWIRRDYFPGEVVIACALDTGISLQWLATGKGTQSFTAHTDFTIPKKYLNAGRLESSGNFEADITFISYEFNEPVFVYSNSGSWIVDFGVTDISNGRWILGIDDKYDIYDVILLPGKKISVINKGASFNCGIEEVTITGKIVVTMEYNF